MNGSLFEVFRAPKVGIKKAGHLSPAVNLNKPLFLLDYDFPESAVLVVGQCQHIDTWSQDRDIQ
jgi:hypothetical protein